MAPGIQIAAKMDGVDLLVTLAENEVRWDSNYTVARNAYLPFASAETSQLTVDGETLMQRSIDWVAGSGQSSGSSPPLPPPVVLVESSTENKVGGSTTLDIPAPVPMLENDLVIAVMVTDGDTTVSLLPAVPGDWTQIEKITDAVGEVTLAVWWKLASASEPANYQFNWGSSEHAYGWIMRLTNHNQIAPIEAQMTTVGGAVNISPPTPVVTSLTNNAMIMSIGGFDDDDITIGSPGLVGMTPLNMGDSGNGPATVSGGSGYYNQTLPGASTSSNFSLTNSEQFVTVTIAIAVAP